MIVALAVFLAAAESVATCPAQTDSGRLKTQAVKGVELYSWKDEGGAFRYSLLWGTNRNKTDTEIKAPPCVLHDVPALKAALGRLAVGEHVFWANATCPKKDCELPSPDMMRDLSSHAHVVRVTLEPAPPAQAQ